MTSAIWETERGTILKVTVRPKSREKSLVAEISPEIIVVNLKVKIMAKALAVSSSSITLVAGHKSREKTLLVQGLSPEDIEQRLSNVT